MGGPVGAEALGSQSVIAVGGAARCLRALAVVLDLANGLVEDKSARTAAFALRLAQDAGLSVPEQHAAWYAALLRHLGCTAFAAVEGALVSDDVAFRARLLRADSPRAVIGAVLGANRGDPARSAGTLARAALGATAIRARWVAEACEAARLLAGQLGLGPAVVTALDEVFERYDGRGWPRGLGGDGTTAVSRVANVAHAAVIGWIDAGQEGADAALRVQMGRALDPALALRARRLLRHVEDEVEVEVGDVPIEVDTVLTAFGDFADLQVPSRRGHSRAVAAICGGAAEALRMTPAERTALVRAAHVHDLGEVAVPTSLLMAARPLRASEWERLRLHPYLTERVLAGAEGLEEVARIAGAHHERLDGRGYHRGAAGHAIPRAARVLAAADMYCALVSPRPHRPALGQAAARDLLRAGVLGGELDGECVEAVLAASGDRRAALCTAAALTGREVEVLRELAIGRTNKEIGAALGISARTVQNHTLRIYEKLGVSTRAGAALRAVQAGLLG